MRHLFLFLLVGSWLTACSQTGTQPAEKYTPMTTIESWQQNHTSNQQVYQQGIVYKLLQDDNEGSRHQKTIVKLDNGTTLLISHNIDLAPRIPDLQNGDILIFYGEYEWNNKGGVVHWTHKDPKGRHPDGFLMYKGKRYD